MEGGTKGYDSSMDKQHKILDFIKTKELMVISTVSSDGRPEAAVVGFGQTDSLHLIFGTSNTSRKYRNLKTDPHVACVIGWDDSRTVQLEGTAREISGDEEQRYCDMYYTKSPAALRFKDMPDERHFLIEPTWIRYTDDATEPWTIIEITF
jgi:general stress protein 26